MEFWRSFQKRTERHCFHLANALQSQDRRFKVVFWRIYHLIRPLRIECIKPYLGWWALAERIFWTSWTILWLWLRLTWNHSPAPVALLLIWAFPLKKTFTIHLCSIWLLIFPIAISLHFVEPQWTMLKDVQFHTAANYTLNNALNALIDIYM